MKLNPNSTTPLHAQAEAELRRLIASDEYINGKLLPNEVELSEQFHISRNTLRQAISKLVYEGLLVRKKGVGTRVARKSITGGMKNWHSFSQEMKMLGIEVRNFELHVSWMKATREIADIFGVEEGTRVLVLERLRGNTEFPFVYFISYFNPVIPLSGDEDYTQPLYDILEKQHGVVVEISREEISADLAGERMAKKLEIAPCDPILIRKRSVFDNKGMLVEYNIGYYRADSFTYTLEASR